MQMEHMNGLAVTGGMKEYVMAEVLMMKALVNINGMILLIMTKAKPYERFEKLMNSRNLAILRI